MFNTLSLHNEFNNPHIDDYLKKQSLNLYSRLTIVKNKYTKMYLKYFNFMLSVLQIHLHT